MSESDMQKLELPANITISECSDLQKTMQAALSSSENVELDASNVDKVDTAGMQLIAAFVMAHKNNKNKGGLNFSEKVNTSAMLLGITDILN